VVAESVTAGGGAVASYDSVATLAGAERIVKTAVDGFGRLDVLVNNAGILRDKTMLKMDEAMWDGVISVHLRGTFLCTQKCLPHLKRAENPHVLMISPPLRMDERWFAPHVAYTIAKYGMSLCVLGMAGEFRGDGIAVNALWPRTIIDTAALQALPTFGPRERLRTRKPTIVADAAHVILTRESRTFTGQFCIDDEVLRSAGVTDFSQYLHENASEADLLPDLFL